MNEQWTNKLEKSEKQNIYIHNIRTLQIERHSTWQNKFKINPYKHSVLFVGHMQTVQT